LQGGARMWGITGEIFRLSNYGRVGLFVKLYYISYGNILKLALNK
jgi:hypothetical protein